MGRIIFLYLSCWLILVSLCYARFMSLASLSPFSPLSNSHSSSSLLNPPSLTPKRSFFPSLSHSSTSSSLTTSAPIKEKNVKTKDAWPSFFTSILAKSPSHSRKPSPPHHHQLISFLSGGFAGMIASSITMPLEVVKTQLQASSAISSASPAIANGVTRRASNLFQEIYQKDGLLGFFRGLSPMLVGIIPTRAIYFWSYSTSKELLKSYFQVPKESSINHLISAFTAGITSNTVREDLHFLFFLLLAFISLLI